MKKLILIIFVLIGCGTEEEKNQQPELPQKNYGKYEMFVDNFIAIAEQEGVVVGKQQIDNLRLIDTADQEQILNLGFNKYTLGVCLIQRYNSIHIEKRFSETAKATLLKFVIFHELGHCLLNAEHTHDKSSLMAEQLPDFVYFTNDEKVFDNAIRKFFQNYLQGKFTKNEDIFPIVINNGTLP